MKASITIKQVQKRSDLRKFIDFPEIIYKDNPYWVPALRGDEFDTFNPKKNAAYEYCEAECYLAYKDGQIVGRVAAIINHKANQMWKEAVVRFGWLDFIEDIEVLRALLDAVITFGKERKCELIKGPLGFTDMDKEGLLVEGYDKLSSFTCLYNYPYYGEMLEKLGYTKDADWTQKVVKVEEQLPRMFEFGDIVAEKFGLRCYKPKSTKELADRFGLDIFHLYNEAFVPLFEFAPLSDRQIKDYLETYTAILDKDFVAVCIDANEKPVGFAFCVPSLSKAIKKSRGRLGPLGLLRLFRALKKNDTLEALMIGVLPEYQGKGAILPIFKYLHQNAIKRGIKRMVLNPQLEDNLKVQNLFEQYETTPYTRRRSYIKKFR